MQQVQFVKLAADFNAGHFFRTNVIAVGVAFSVKHRLACDVERQAVNRFAAEVTLVRHIRADFVNRLQIENAG